MKLIIWKIFLCIGLLWAICGLIVSLYYHQWINFSLAIGITVVVSYEMYKTI